MVSTDGHRLSKVERTIANGPKLSAGVIIPKQPLKDLAALQQAAGRPRSRRYCRMTRWRAPARRPERLTNTHVTVHSVRLLTRKPSTEAPAHRAP